MGTSTATTVTNGKESKAAERQQQTERGDDAKPGARRAHPGQQVLGEGNEEARRRFLARKMSSGQLTAEQQRAVQHGKVALQTAQENNGEVEPGQRGEINNRDPAPGVDEEAAQQPRERGNAAVGQPTARGAEPPKTSNSKEGSDINQEDHVSNDNRENKNKLAKLLRNKRNERSREAPRDPQAQPDLVGKRVAVLFAGDTTSPGCYVQQFKERGAIVTTWEKKQDEAGQDLGRRAVQREFMERLEAGEFDFVFLCPPCSSFATDHDDCLRPMAAPWGEAAPKRWQNYIGKHNRLIQFTLDVIRKAHELGVPWMLEHPASRRHEPNNWPEYEDWAALWDMVARCA